MSLITEKLTIRSQHRDPLYEALAAQCDGFNGLTGDLMAIALDPVPDRPPWSFSTIAKQLEEDLEFDDVASFVEAITHEGIYYCLFDAVDLAKSLELAKAALERRELLDVARILSAAPQQLQFEINRPERSSASAAALDNVSPELQLFLERHLNLKTVCVALAAGQGSPVWNDPDIAASLGQALHVASASDLDATVLSGGQYFLFFRCRQIAPALQALKASLLELGLSDHAKILLAEPSENKFQVYWPPAKAGTLV